MEHQIWQASMSVDEPMSNSYHKDFAMAYRNMMALNVIFLAVVLAILF
ncbi:hypothetical protein [Herbaspirillum sp. 1130]|nr:hypothetical protein [Herbaspirillum sp. 1130]MBP1318296.1 hypothetical protein [Herbaspirillum sp. 1130]